jgi:hypothetical protein
MPTVRGMVSRPRSVAAVAVVVVVAVVKSHVASVNYAARVNRDRRVMRTMPMRVRSTSTIRGQHSIARRSMI